MQWSIVTPSNIKILDGNVIELSQNNKKMYLRVITKSKILLKTWSTEPVNSYDAENPGTIRVGFEAQLAANETSDFSVIFSPTNEKIIVRPLIDWK
jgi:hypothetical protein